MNKLKTETFFIEHSQGKSKRKSLYEAIKKWKEMYSLGRIYKLSTYEDGKQIKEYIYE